MIPGAIRLVDCSVVPCNVDVPSRTFTSITANVIATTTFASGNLEYLFYTTKFNGLGCTGGDSRWYATTLYDPYNFIDIKSWITSSVSKTKVVWTYDPGSVNTQLPTGITSGGGIYYRPGSTTMLASGISYKQNKYGFTRSLSEGDYVQHTTSTIPGAGTDTSWACCAPEIPGPDVEIISPGATVSKTINTASISPMYILYLGVSTNVVYGMTLQLKSAGVANSPWTVKVEGGSIIFIDKNGTTTTYSGTLTAARTAINAAGNFTAVIGTNITATAGVTNANVSDLLPFLSHPLTVTTCTTGLPLVKPGTELAPSSTGCGIYRVATTAAKFAFTTGLGFPDTKAGLDLFLNSSWFPKNSFFQDGGVNTFWYYTSNEFDYYVISPDSSLFLLTGGPSVQTKVITVTENSNQTDVYTGTTTCGNGDPFNPCPPQPQCNSFVIDSCFNICTGAPLSSCSIGIPYEGCCGCTNLVTTVVPGSSRNLTATQTLTGSFSVQ